jgi:hypothetical protein
VARYGQGEEPDLQGEGDRQDEALPGAEGGAQRDEDPVDEQVDADGGEQPDR